MSLFAQLFHNHQIYNGAVLAAVLHHHAQSRVPKFNAAFNSFATLLSLGAKLICDLSKDTWSVLMTTCHRSSSIRNVIVTGKS